MDIHTESGTKVKYIEENPSKAQIRWGGNVDPTGFLVVGMDYTIDKLIRKSSHTKVFLKEFPGKQFNSVWFENTIINMDSK